MTKNNVKTVVKTGKIVNFTMDQIFVPPSSVKIHLFSLKVQGYSIQNILKNLVAVFCGKNLGKGRKTAKTVLKTVKIKCIKKNCPISLWTDFPHFGSKTTFWVLHLTFKIRTNVLSKKMGFKKIMAPCRTTVPFLVTQQFSERFF
jgi:hypothetical protein